VGCEECRKSYRQLPKESLGLYFIEGFPHYVCLECAQELGWI
jgi:hypothetical protein